MLEVSVAIGRSFTALRSLMIAVALAFAPVALAMSAGQGGHSGLYFQGGSTFKVVPRSSTLRAVVQRTRLKKKNEHWLVARVENGNQLANNTLNFQPLPKTNASDAASDQRLATSPPLPTKTMGLYIVKLSGAGNRRVAPIHYQVSGQINAQLGAPQSVVLVTPGASEKISRDYKFQWVAGDETPFYRFELYVSRFVPYFGRGDQQAQSDTTVYQYGRLLPGHLRAFSMSEMSTPTLRKDSSIYWRIVGLDAGGNTVSVSPLQHVQIYP